MNEAWLPSDKLVSLRRTMQALLAPGVAPTSGALQIMLAEVNAAVVLTEDLEEEHRNLKHRMRSSLDEIGGAA